MKEDMQMGANSLPENETFTNADEALAETVTIDLAAEQKEGGVLTNSIIHTITSRFAEAQRFRESDEKRWLDAYHNYRGIYGKNVRFREEEKSQVFVKVTKTKVVAAFGQLLDVLFGNKEFPLTIAPTEVPEGTSEYVHFKQGEGKPEQEMDMESANMEMMEEDKKIPTPINPYAHLDVGYAGDGREIPPGAKMKDIITQGIGLKVEPDQLAQNFVEGPANEGEPQFKPADMAAKRMQKLIHDQIGESRGAEELRKSLFELCLLGTGIIKGPFTSYKTLHRWMYDPETKKRSYTPERVKVPKIEYCSLWNAFPDTNATTMEDCEWFIQRHKMSRSQLRGLKDRPFFDKGKIEDVLRESPNYIQQDYEQEINTENSNMQESGDRYEVLEYWGVIDSQDLKNAGVLQDEVKNELSEVQINAWICHNKILRVVLNPFTPKRIPYLAFHYEKNPYSFFGIGVAENMADSQEIMNGHMRMAIDNLAYAGNLVFDVDENALEPGQDMKMYPGKIFKRQGGNPGQAVYGIKFPNTAPENMQIFDKFRQIADEETGIPSYAHGQTGVMSTTRTAAGMSMLLGAATLSVKTVIKNIDDFLLKPLGEAFFQWNMSFYEGELDIVGDLEVRAGGAASLMQNEIRSQRLTAFGQLFANPAIAPFIKIPAYVKAFVESLELDPDELINDIDQAKVYAAIIGAAGGIQMPQQQAPMGNGMGEMGGVPSPTLPGEAGFSGNPEQGGGTSTLADLGNIPTQGGQ